MSRSFANSLGMAAFGIFVLLVVNDAQSLFSPGVGFPRVVTTLMVCAVGVLASAYLTFRIVHGHRPDPAYSKEELTKLIQDAVGEQMRAEIETVLRQMFLMANVAGSQLDATPPPRPTPRPVSLIKAREGD